MFLTFMKWQHKWDKPRNSKKNASFPLHERWKVGSWFSSVLLSESIFYSTGSLELEWACMCSAINAMGLEWTLTCQDLLHYDEKPLPVCTHAHAHTHKHNFLKCLLISTTTKTKILIFKELTFRVKGVNKTSSELCFMLVHSSEEKSKPWKDRGFKGGKIII